MRTVIHLSKHVTDDKNILFQKEHLQVSQSNCCSKQDYQEHHGKVSHVFALLSFENIWWWIYYIYSGLPRQLLYITLKEKDKINK